MLRTGIKEKAYVTQRSSVVDVERSRPDNDLSYGWVQYLKFPLVLSHCWLGDGQESLSAPQNILLIARGSLPHRR